MKTILIDAVNTTIIKNEIGEFVQFQDLFNLLEAYNNPKIIVTNANDEQIINFGLDKVSLPVFTMKHNPDKPDPVYFKTLLEQFNLKPENVIYFEHNIDAVNSAKSLNINTYYYDKDEKDLIKLKSFLDNNL